MEDLRLQAIEWRKRAAKRRAMAATMKPETQSTLLQAAETWLKMADQAERLAASTEPDPTRR